MSKIKVEINGFGRIEVWFSMQWLKSNIEVVGN